MLILCKAWAPRRRLCDVQNGRKAFVSSASHLISISVSEKQDFKKVMLILAVFSWRRRRCFSFRSNARDNQSRLQSDYSWGYSAEDYSLGWMAGTCYFSICCFLLSLSLLFSVWERDGEEDWQCVFPRCTSVERVCRSLSVSVSFTVKSKTEVVISTSHAGSLYLNKAAFVLFETLSASFVHASDDLHWRH